MGDGDVGGGFGAEVAAVPYVVVAVVLGLAAWRGRVHPEV